MKKVSIIVPIYNVEKYLKRCIDSILNQTYSNLEIILVNDGSLDNCGNICDDYTKKDDRIIVIHHSNKGLPAARNSGLKIATGYYIGFIDSDDKIDNNMVEDFINIANKNNDPDIITSDIFQYSLDNKNYNHIKNKSYIYGKTIYKKDIKNNYIKPYFGGELGNIPSVCTKMYKASFLSLNNLMFDETLVRAADYWFNLEAFQKATTLYSIEKSYYHYFVIQNSNIRKYRKNDFIFFLTSRERLTKENLHLKIDTNWTNLNTQFINNINEFIFLIIKHEKINVGFKKIDSIFKNNEYIDALNNSSLNKTHTKLIRFLLKNKFYKLSFLLYLIWFKTNKFFEVSI